MHHRLEPKRRSFVYNVFMFAIDLDEINLLSKRFFLMSWNRFNAFSFSEKDHLFGRVKPIKEEVVNFVESQSVQGVTRVVLITNLRTWGYNFNPVSFYFCYDKQDNPVCAVAEVGNTFGEQKLFFLGPDTLQDKHAFRLRIKKYFYVSPFFEMDTEFDFDLAPPDDKIDIRINDFRNDKKIFLSSLVGVRKEMTNTRLLFYCFRFPFITLQIIFLIHWNAFILIMKRIKYFKKTDQAELQRDFMILKDVV